MNLRATFTSHLRDSVVVIYDHGAKSGRRSVVADARAVVAYCLARHGNYRIVLRHHRGNWQELLHDGESFLAIAHLPTDYFARIADFCGIPR